MAQTTETDTETPTGTQDNTFIDSNESVDEAIEEMLKPQETVEEAPEGDPDRDPDPEPAEPDPDADPEPEGDPEPEADPEPDPDKDPEDPPEPEDKKSKKLDEATQAHLDDRIKRLEGKLRAEHKEALEELKKAEDEAKTPKTSIQKVNQSWNTDELDEEDAKAEKMIDFVSDHPEGYLSNEGTDKERLMEPAELRTHREDARLTQKAIRTRRKLIAESELYSAEIHKLVPALADADSDESLELEKVFKEVPELRNKSNAKYLALALLLGDRQLTKKPKEKSKATKKAPNKTPIKAPSLGNSENRAGTTSKTDGDPKALLDALSTGDEDAIDAYLEHTFPG